MKITAVEYICPCLWIILLQLQHLGLKCHMTLSEHIAFVNVMYYFVVRVGVNIVLM